MSNAHARAALHAPTARLRLTASSHHTQVETQLTAQQGLLELTRKGREAAESLATERETSLSQAASSIAELEQSLAHERATHAQAAAAASERERELSEAATAARKQRDLEISIVNKALEKADERVQAQLANLPEAQARQLATAEERLQRCDNSHPLRLVWI